MNNKSKYFSRVKRIILEFVFFLLCVIFFFCIYHMGFAGIKQVGRIAVKETKIVEISGISEENGNFFIKDRDSWIIADYEPGYILHIGLDFKDGKTREGRIYYAGPEYIFSEGHAFDYSFRSGDNYIKIKDPNARYVRMDIEDENGCIFEITSLDQESRFTYALKHINYFLVLTFAVLITVLFELLKYREDAKKTKTLFLLLLILSTVLIFGQFIVGKAYFIFTDIGSDTFNQYYPYFVNCALSIRDGSFSVWNWDYGLGTSILNVISWTMDPFAIAVVLCGVIFGAGAIHYALVWMQIVKIIVCYFLCKRYLKLFCENEFAVCLGAYLCSLNGYLMLWGQHYFLGTACIYVLIVFIAIEKFVRYKGRKEGGWLALATAVALIYSYYTTYMILAASAVYFLIRYFETRGRDTLKDTLRIFVKCLFAVVSGMCLAGVVFIPACYYTLTNSSRLSGASASVLNRIGYSFLTSFNLDETGTRLSRLLSNNILYINDHTNTYFGNYYEAPQICCTIFIFFFVTQWMIYEWKKSKESKSRVLYGIKLAFMYLLLFNSASGLILNGFVYAAHRYTFIIFPLLSLVITLVWDKVYDNGQQNLWGILAGILLSGIAGWYSYKHGAIEVENYSALVFVFLAVGTFILLLAWRLGSENQKLMDLFFVLTVIAAITEGYITNNQRTFVTKENYALSWHDGELDGDTARAIRWIEDHDDSVYRIEKMYNDWGAFSDSFFEQYSTVTWYNSTPNTNVLEFYDQIYKDASIFDDVSLNNAIKTFNIDTELAVSSINMVNTKYILSKRPLEYDWCEKIHEEGTVLVYRNLNTDSIAKWYSKTILKEEFEKLDDVQRAQILKDTLVVDTSVDISPDSEGSVGKFVLTGQTRLSGSVVCDNMGFLLISIPDQEGWTVYVDGKKAEIYNADYGFVAVKISQGEHDITAEYKVPKRELGILLSIAGALMVGVLVFADCRNGKNSN